MNSPVLQALLNARIEEEPTVFGKWCITQNVKALPHVAAFIRDREPIAPTETIWQAVQEVSQSHLSHGFADPTVGGVVAETMNSISNITQPRWPKDLLPRFNALPYDVQRYLASRDKEQEKIVRRRRQRPARRSQQFINQRQQMAINRTRPLDERIKSICADAEAFVDAAAAERKKLFDGLPLATLRRRLENKAPGCACKQALAILEAASDEVWRAVGGNN